MALAWLLLAALLWPLFFRSAAAPKKKPALDTYAVVSGSVFADSGYALPGARCDPRAPGRLRAADKTKPIETVSDARGEFVVRVPPGPVHYMVTVDAKGYQSQRKTVSVQDQERVEVTFQLERESK